MKKYFSFIITFILVFQIISLVFTQNAFARNAGGRFEESFDYARLADGDNFPTVSDDQWDDGDGDYNSYNAWRSFGSPLKTVRSSGNKYLEVAHSGKTDAVQLFGQVLFDSDNSGDLFKNGTISTPAIFSFKVNFKSDAQVNIQTFGGTDIRSSDDVCIDVFYKSGKLYVENTALANVEKNKWYILNFVIDNENNKYYVEVLHDDNTAVISLNDNAAFDFANKKNKTGSFCFRLYSGADILIDDVSLKAIPLSKISEYTKTTYTLTDFLNFKKHNYNYAIDFKKYSYNYAIDDTDFLKADGTRVANQKGENVVLRGVNLGNWLLQESWMCPTVGQDGKWAYWDTLNTFEKRFGKEKTQALIDLWEDMYITEKDLDNIRSLGMNVVRVPFWYRNFMDDDGNYKLDKNGNVDLSRLEWIVDECGKRGIYVLLDMHGLPGLQSNNHSTGRINSCHVFDNTEEGEMYRQRAEDLWVEIAKRFAGNPAVAAYDLFNEPYNEMTRNSTTNKNVWELYNRLYNAIRKVDPDHMISMEAVWEWNTLPNPSEYGWKNVLYQFHNYNYKESEIDNKVNDTKNHASWNVPSIVGEFESGSILNYTLNMYNKNNIGWIMWTYKGTNKDGSGPSGWYMYHSVATDEGNENYAYNTTPRVDPENDSYDQIWQKYSRMRTDDSFMKNDVLINTVEPYTYVYTKSPVAKRMCRISFNTNGGSDVYDAVVACGNKLSFVTEPVKDGYIFAGWFEDANCTDEWNMDTDTVRRDTVLYAKWLDKTSLKYNISFKNISADEAVIGIEKLTDSSSEGVMLMVLYDGDGKILKAENKKISSADTEIKFGLSNAEYQRIKVFLLNDMLNASWLSKTISK